MKNHELYILNVKQLKQVMGDSFFFLKSWMQGYSFYCIASCNTKYP